MRRPLRWVFVLELFVLRIAFVATSAPACHSSPSSVTPPSPDGGDGAAPGAAEAAARAQLDAMIAAYGIQQSDLVLEWIETDDLGYVHVRFQQMFHAIEVSEGEVIVHFAPDPSLFTITDALSPNVTADPKPSVTPDAAVAAAAAAYVGGAGALAMPPAAPALTIVRLPDADHLAFEVAFQRASCATNTDCCYGLPCTPPSDLSGPVGNLCCIPKQGMAARRTTTAASTARRTRAGTIIARRADSAATTPTGRVRTSMGHRRFGLLLEQLHEQVLPVGQGAAPPLAVAPHRCWGRS